MAISNFKQQIPNIITIFRIILVIPILVFFLINDIGVAYTFAMDNNVFTIYWNNSIILILFVIASISDWLDGYLSRKYQWVSDFGKILDPIADKVLINSVLICLCIQNYTYVLFTVLFIARDTIVDALRMYSASRNIIVPANFFGKLKTVLQMFAIIIILFIGVNLNSINLTWWYWAIQNGVMILALSVSIFSGIKYIIDFMKVNFPNKMPIN